MAGKPRSGGWMTAGRRRVLLLLTVAACLLSIWWCCGQLRLRNRIPQQLQIRSSEHPETSPIIRVNLTPNRTEHVSITVDGRFRLRALPSGRTLSQADRLPPTVVSGSAQAILFGATKYSVERLEIEPQDSPAIWVNDHQYRGSVRISLRPDETLLVVNRLPLEDYVASVVDSEMPADFPPAARHAQAVVARTYALDRMQTAAANLEYDLDTTSSSQCYLGFQYRSAGGRRLAGESSDSRRVAGETRGLVCTYRGKLFRTYYSAVCGGHTTFGPALFRDAAPTLKGVPCQWCSAARFYRWKSHCSLTRVNEALRRHFRSAGLQFGTLQALTGSAPPANGGIPELQASDGQRSHRVPTTVLRRYLPRQLFSPFFAVENRDGELHFAGRGHGHGVGLCQWGARGLGLTGKNSLEILNYYYPGSRVVNLRYDQLAHQPVPGTQPRVSVESHGKKTAAGLK